MLAAISSLGLLLFDRGTKHRYMKENRTSARVRATLFQILMAFAESHEQRDVVEGKRTAVTDYVQ